ncbi:MAG: hypothetical protein WCC50_01260, partial [Pseudolabrys sp.]
PMSALGHKWTFCDAIVMSALPPIADMCGALGDVRFVPIADVAFSNSMDVQAVVRDIGVAVPRSNY